jgi:HEPN domain-containing protein
MVETAIITEWLDKADEDYEFALVNLEENRPFPALISFHFHQSAEKYLKAYIVANDLEFIKSHDLPALLKICVRQNPSLLQLNPDCEYLNTFYIETRYPVHWPTHFTLEESSKDSFGEATRPPTSVFFPLASAEVLNSAARTACSCCPPPSVIWFSSIPVLSLREVTYIFMDVPLGSFRDIFLFCTLSTVFCILATSFHYS